MLRFSLLVPLLVVGFMLSPNLAFGQQAEPIKRVNITITAQEKTAEREIIQLPADNQPKVIDVAKKYPTIKVKKARPFAGITTVKKEVNPTPVKPTVAPLKPIAKPVQKPTATVVTLKPKNTVAPIKTAVTKPTPTTETSLKPSATPSQTMASTNRLKPSAGNLKPETGTSNTPQKTEATTKEKAFPATAAVSSDDDLSVNQNADNNRTLQNSNSDKANTISYVWIGVILLIAGIILGLLFGRAAFLVSFVGVIFILLGIFTF